MTLPAPLAVVALVLAMLPAAAAETTDRERGRTIAEQLCGRCHATGDSGASPHKITPPFRDLAERFPVDMLVDAMTSGEISGHDEMPMFVLEPEDMTALLAHIDAYAPVGKRYLELPKRAD